MCSAPGDTARAAILYDRLSPYVDLCAWVPVFWLGSWAFYLGLLSRTLSRWDDAERHFRQAVEVNGRIGVLPYLAHAQ